MEARTQAEHARVSEIEAHLRAVFSPVTLHVQDESDRHAGHAGWRPGGATHLRVTMVASAFTGKSRIEKHRLVHTALAAFMENGVHALALHLTSPDEAL